MYSRKQTKNGLEVIVSPMPHMTSVTVGVWIGTGGRYESAKESGISHFIEHMLFKGTYERTAKDLKQAIEGIGGSFNGFTSDEVTCYMVKVPANYLELGIGVLSDMVFNAKFDEEDLAKEKFVICEEIKMYRDQPAEHVQDILNSVMWPGNPLGRPLTGAITTVKNFKRDQLMSFKEKSYQPANMAVVAAGKIHTDKFFEYTSGKFNGYKKKKKMTFKSPALSQKSPRMKVEHGGTKQTHIAMGFPAVDSHMSERFAMKLMNVIFGGNMSSRLFEELREKYGLCYDISSSYKRHSDVGEVTIHAGVDNRNALKSTIAILDEIKNIRDIGVTEDELTRAKEYAKGQFLLAMERTSTRMVWLGDRLMVHRHIPEVEEIVKRIDEVTVENIKEVCEKIFRSSKVNLAMVGNISIKEKDKIKKEMNKL